VEASFAVADGYYLYRDKLRFSATPEAVALGSVTLPAGKVKEDPFFGRVETYRDRVVVRLPLDNAAPGQVVTVRAESQGCADAGVCYPPNAQSVTVTLPGAGAPPGVLIEANPPRKRWFN
jgi:thiol:disulfide interchange protein DsbD